MGKKRKRLSPEELPSTEQLEEELKRVNYMKQFHVKLRSTIYTLLTVMVLAVLIAVLLLPVLRIYGPGMNPTLQEKDIVLSLKTSRFGRGDVVAFYYNNKILVKRIIALPGDVLDIDRKGTVYLNNQILDEPYVEELAIGDCNISFPYTVPDARIFVMGDNRVNSIDSRHTAVGCVAEEQIIGKIAFRVWPSSRIGWIK